MSNTLIQGTAEWHEARYKSFNASEAPAMMGASNKVTRNELLHIKATGSEREFSDWVQRNLFDKGHEYEAKARVIVEDSIGEDLYPTVFVNEDIEGLKMLASLDGITMLGDTNFEHKMWNKDLAERVKANDLPAEYYWQLEHQMLVSGAEKTIFVCSDGTEENFVTMAYEPVDGRAKELIAGWKQFAEDLANYVPQEKKPEPVGRGPESLPALHIEVSGEVLASNLSDYRDYALNVIRSINRDLVTDQDFADAENTIKWCQEVETRLEASKEHALSQTQSIDELFKTIDAIKEETRSVRLELNRLVKTEKENRRNEILMNAQADFNAHVQKINKELVDAVLPNIDPDIVSAMKGKRTLDSLQNAADTAVAQAKIKANELAEIIKVNLVALDEITTGYEFLFGDKQQLVIQDPTTVKELAKARVLMHQASEKERLEKAAEAERERIRQEEQAKAQAEIAKATQFEQASEPTPEPAPMQTVDEGELINLSQINERIAPISITAQGIATFGIEPKELKGNSRLYSERDFIRLCKAMANYLEQVTCPAM